MALNLEQYKFSTVINKRGELNGPKNILGGLSTLAPLVCKESIEIFQSTQIYQSYKEQKVKWIELLIKNPNKQNNAGRIKLSISPSNQNTLAHNKISIAVYSQNFKSDDPITRERILSSNDKIIHALKTNEFFNIKRYLFSDESENKHCIKTEISFSSPDNRDYPKIQDIFSEYSSRSNSNSWKKAIALTFEMFSNIVFQEGFFDKTKSQKIEALDHLGKTLDIASEEKSVIVSKKGTVNEKINLLKLTKETRQALGYDPWENSLGLAAAAKELEKRNNSNHRL